MVDIVSRAEWSAKPPRGVTAVTMPSEKVYIHHSADSNRGAAGMRNIQSTHMKPVSQGGRGFRDIAYSFVIDGDDGVVFEGRGAGIQGGHVLGSENRNHGICLMGNYEHATLNDAARRSLVDLLRHGRDQGWWKLTTIVGHKQDPGIIANPDEATACPGKHLFDELGAIAQAVGAPAALGTITTATEEDEDQMFLYSAPNQPVFFCDGGVSVGLNEGTDMETFNAQKVKHFRLDADTFAKFRARYPGA